MAALAVEAVRLLASCPLVPLVVLWLRVWLRLVAALWALPEPHPARATIRNAQVTSTGAAHSVCR